MAEGTIKKQYLLQVLRSESSDRDYATALSELKTRLETIGRKDGEFITMSYKDKDKKAHTLIGITRMQNDGYTGAEGGSVFIDVEAIDKKIEDAIKVLLGEGGETGLNIQSLDAAIKKEVEDREAAITATEGKIAEEIAKLDKDDTAVDGEFVTAVSETDGVITVTRGEVSTSQVKGAAISGDDTTISVEAGTAQSQIIALAKAIKSVEGNASKYKVVKLTDDEIEALSDAANVKEAYKVVAYVGDGEGAEKAQVGDTIKIYKDSALKSVTTSGDTNTEITFVYTLADGTEKTVKVDLGKAIFESEMGNGIEVVENKIKIKLDAANESDFLSVSEDGLKLSGVANAIATAISTAVSGLDKDDTAVDGKFVTAVSETDGVITVTRGEVSTSQVKGAAISGDDTIEIPAGTAQGQIEALAKAVKAGQTAAQSAVNALEMGEKGGTGKFIQSIKQVKGVVTAEAVALNAAAVSATAITGDNDKVTVTGTTLEGQIVSLATTAKTIEGKANDTSGIVEEVIGAVGLGDDGKLPANTFAADGIFAGKTSILAALQSIQHGINCGMY